MASEKSILIGNVKIGGGADVAIQSMTNTKTNNVDATVKQIKELEKAGCDIVRVTVPDMDSAYAIDKIKEKISIPLVADIHFDYKIALECIERGIDKVRINPGNIGDRTNVRTLAKKANEKNIPIRIGVNSGSIDKDILVKGNKVYSPNTCCLVPGYVNNLFTKHNISNAIILLSELLITPQAHVRHQDTHHTIALMCHDRRRQQSQCQWQCPLPRKEDVCQRRVDNHQ